MYPEVKVTVVELRQRGASPAKSSSKACWLPAPFRISANVKPNACRYQLTRDGDALQVQALPPLCATRSYNGRRHSDGSCVSRGAGYTHGKARFCLLAQHGRGSLELHGEE